MAEGNVVRCTVIFRGRVQGVGFRFTTENIATSFRVTGYVMNLRDGTVRMQVEGSREDVTLMIRRVLDTMRGHVADHSKEWGTATGEFREFGIRYEGR